MGGSFVIIKNRTVGYSAIQGFFWMGYAAIIGFSSVYLLQAGLDNSQVGLLIAVTGLLSALLQPVVAGYADRRGSMPLKWIICCIAGTSLVCAAVLGAAGSRKVLAGFCYGCCMVLLQLNTPLVNSLGIATVNGGEKLNFGVARGFGSLGYAAAAYAIGALTDRFGAGTVPLSIGLGLVLLLLATADYPKTPRPEETQQTRGAGLTFLRRYPRYCLVLVGLVLIFISHAVLNSFTYQIVVEKGGDSAQMGAAMAFASTVELPVMFLFGWMQKKKPGSFWFRISGLFFLLKNLGTLLCTDMTGFFAVQVFQMGGFALLTISAVFYVNSIMAPGDRVKGQACYTMTMTLGNVIGAAAAGRILDELGVPAMLTFGTACALLGAAMMLLFTEKTE